MLFHLAKWLLTLSNESKRFARLRLWQCKFDSDIVHWPRVKHQLQDALSNLRTDGNVTSDLDDRLLVCIAKTTNKWQAKRYLTRKNPRNVRLRTNKQYLDLINPHWEEIDKCLDVTNNRMPKDKRPRTIHSIVYSRTDEQCVLSRDYNGSLNRCIGMSRRPKLQSNAKIEGRQQNRTMCPYHSGNASCMHRIIHRLLDTKAKGACMIWW